MTAPLHILHSIILKCAHVSVYVDVVCLNSLLLMWNKIWTKLI